MYELVPAIVLWLPTGSMLCRCYSRACERPEKQWCHAIRHENTAGGRKALTAQLLDHMITCPQVRSIMHALCVSVYCSVLPRCGFTVSLLCNCNATHVSTPWTVGTHREIRQRGHSAEDLAVVVVFAGIESVSTLGLELKADPVQLWHLRQGHPEDRPHRLGTSVRRNGSVQQPLRINAWHPCAQRQSLHVRGRALDGAAEVDKGLACMQAGFHQLQRDVCGHGVENLHRRSLSERVIICVVVLSSTGQSGGQHTADASGHASGQRDIHYLKLHLHPFTPTFAYS